MKKPYGRWDLIKKKQIVKIATSDVYLVQQSAETLAVLKIPSDIGKQDVSATIWSGQSVSQIGYALQVAQHCSRHELNSTRAELKPPPPHHSHLQLQLYSDPGVWLDTGHHLHLA